MADSCCSVRGTLHPSTWVQRPVAAPTSVNGASAAVAGQEERIEKLTAFYAKELARRIPPTPPLWRRALAHVTAHGPTGYAALWRALGTSSELLSAALKARHCRHYFAREGPRQASTVGATAAGLAEMARREEV